VSLACREIDVTFHLDNSFRPVFNNPEGRGAFKVHAGFDFLQLLFVDPELLLLPPALQKLVGTGDLPEHYSYNLNYFK
jgi:hypothetical protein